MISFGSVDAAALMSLMFVICHMFSRRRNSQILYDNKLNCY